MKVQEIKHERDYNYALKRADELFMSKPGTLNGGELAILLAAIKIYEDRHHAIESSDMSIENKPTD